MGDVLTLDLEGALERVDGDRELLIELVEIFFDVYEEQVVQLVAAMKSGDSKQVFEVSHSIKGAAGNVGAMAAAMCAKELELRGYEKNLDDATPILESLQKEVGLFRNECSSNGLVSG